MKPKTKRKSYKKLYFDLLDEALRQNKPKKVSFITTKRVPKRVNVSFSTKRRRKVSFIATKRIPKRVKIKFK